jgi:hypothetical protein
MNNSDDYKSILKNYIILIALIIFVVVYVIINLDIVKKGDIYNGDLTKSILLTAIIVLILYLFVTWDEDNYTEENKDNIKEFPIAKFNLGTVNKPIMIEPTQPIQTINKVNVSQPTMNELGQAQLSINKPGEMKTRIVNPTTNQVTQPVYSNPVIELNRVKNNIDRYDNPNIFISQKNIGKYGIKF